jgi:Secretion system C-terminal sorting domain
MYARLINFAFLALLGLICTASPSISQTWTHNGPREGGDISIHPLLEGVVFLHAEDRVWRSSDSGDTWDEVEIEFEPDGYDFRLQFHLTSADTVWMREVTLLSGTYWYLSVDGGVSFFQVDYPLTDVRWKLRQDPFDTEHFLAFTSEFPTDTTRFIESHDGGETWGTQWLLDIDYETIYLNLKELEFDPHHPDRLAACISTFIDANNWGDLVLSDDGGHSWYDPDPSDTSGVDQRLFYHPVIEDLLFVMDEKHQPNYSDRPKLQQLISRDGGFNWEVFGDPWLVDNDGASCFYILPHEYVYAAYNTGLYRSLDLEIWEDVLTAEHGNWPALFARWTDRIFDVQIAPWNEELIFLGGFCRTTDGGVNWETVQLEDSPHVRISAVSLSSNGEVIYINGGGGTHVSADGGASWTPILFDGYYTDVHHDYPGRILADKTQPMGQMYGYYHEWQLSTDGGRTWTGINRSAGRISFDDENPNRIYVSEYSSYYITSNAGLNWNIVSLPRGTRVAQFCFDQDDAQKLYIPTDRGLWRSDFQGFTPYRWSIFNENFGSMTLKAGNNHAALFDPWLENYYGIYSHNNGRSVDHIINRPEATSSRNPRFAPNGNLIVPGTNGIYESEDEGLTWTLLTGEHGQFISTWDIADNGTIVVKADLETNGLWIGRDVLSVDEYPASHVDANPEEFKLITVFPNPFNPSLSITVTLPEPTPVSMWVVNVAGQKVATLANDEPLAAGSHEFTFDGSTFASGIYFVHAEVAGQASVVRKVTLLK